MELILDLPWPPSVNALWKATSKGGLYVSKAVHLYKAAVFAQLYNAKTPKFAITDVLGIEVHAHPPDKRSRDIDNLAKVLHDSLQYAGIIPNDNQIKRLFMEMGCMDIHRKGFLDVKIYTLEPLC